MDQQQAQELAKIIEHEEPHLRAIADVEQGWRERSWVVKLYVKATNEFREIIRSPSEWESLRQYLKDHD